MTLAAAAVRVAAGLDLRAASADFLDDLRWAPDPDDVSQRIAHEPRLVDPRTDAYLAALAEHIGGQHRVIVPAWTREASRFLDHFWWPSRTVGLHARALVESPAAFRRRGIFIGRTTMDRNEIIAALTALRPDPFQTQSLELPGLRCEIASPEVVLVMKALAHRIGEDDDDLRLLASKAGLATAPEVLDLVERMAGSRLLTAQVQFFVEAAMAESA